MKHDHCQFSNCTRSASFNYAGQKSRKFCKQHKEENMVPVSVKLCKQCHKHASFGLAEGPRSIFCAKHKLETMIHSSVRLKPQLVLE